MQNLSHFYGWTNRDSCLSCNRFKAQVRSFDNGPSLEKSDVEVVVLFIVPKDWSSMGLNRIPKGSESSTLKEGKKRSLIFKEKIVEFRGGWEVKYAPPKRGDP